MNVNRHYFSQVNSVTYSISSASTQIASARKDRVFIHISNSENEHMYINLGTAGGYNQGIYIPPYSYYELSSQKGNLYDGTIYASLKHPSNNIIVTVVEGYGI